MRILAVNHRDAAAYYRLIEPLSILSLSEGLDVTFTRSPQVAAAEEYDVLWLQMDYGGDIEVVAREFQALGGKVIYDVDDWLFTYPPSWCNYDLYFERGTGRQKPALESHERLIRLADMVTTTTEYLAAKIRELRSGVYRILPNCVLQGDWDTLIAPQHNVKAPVIGWFGTGNHWEEWYELAPVLDEVLEYIDGSLALIGAPEVLACFPDRLAARTYWTPLVSMASFETIRRAIITFDVGIAWCTDRLETAKCRSPLKALQYGAAGVPVFASDTVYGDVLGRDTFGFTFQTPEDMALTLMEMHGEAWQEMQLRAAAWQERVWSYHTYETQSQHWLEVLA